MCLAPLLISLTVRLRAECASSGILPECAVNFLSTSLPKVKEGKKAKFVLGVSEPKIGNAISETLNIPCACNDLTLELFRGIRLHFHNFIDVTLPLLTPA